MATVEEILRGHDEWNAATKGPGAPTERFVSNALHCCEQSLRVLTRRLRRIGYPISQPFQECADGIDERLRMYQAETGHAVPAILQSFWRTIGGVTLIEFGEYPHCDFWYDKQIEGACGYTDALHIDACTDDWLNDELETVEMYGDEYYLSISPDGYHKDNISGGIPYGITFDSQWSPRLMHFEWAGFQRPKSAPVETPDFMQYVRIAILECAGFPGLYGDDNFESIREELVDGLPVF